MKFWEKLLFLNKCLKIFRKRLPKSTQKFWGKAATEKIMFGSPGVYLGHIRVKTGAGY